MPDDPTSDLLAALQKLAAAAAGEPIPPPQDASPYLVEVYQLAGAAQLLYNERDALKLVEPVLKKLKSAPPEERIAFVLEALFCMSGTGPFGVSAALRAMTASLLRAGLPFSSDDAVKIVELVSRQRSAFPYKAILSALAPLPHTEALRDSLIRLKPLITEWLGAHEIRDLHYRIDELIEGPKHAPVTASAGWTERVFADIESSPRKTQWLELFDHARSLTQTNAPKKWQDAARNRVSAVGREQFVDAARRWLALGPMPDTPGVQVPDQEAAYQKGFVWTIGALGETALGPALADFAFACFKKIPMIGAVSHRVGNACVNALAAMPGLDAVSQLSRLANRIRYDVARRLIEKALTEAAERNNVTRDDLEAMTVPAFGLDRTGQRMEAVGDCEARLAIEGSEAVLEWRREGKILKSVPAAVKADHAEMVNELKRAAKELSGILSTQKLRLERLLMSTRSTVFDLWKEWYLDNPVVAPFTRRLIWEFESESGTQTGIPLDDQLIDWTGNPVATAGTRARLWHPIRSDVQTIVNWRCRLEDDGIQQPFKQAHREVYILTQAERETGTFSNRFASHILRQHQFSALARERGWQYNLMGQWDSHNTPCLDLPRYGVRAEFHVDFPGNNGEAAETTDHGIFKLIRTGQVRFLSTKGPVMRLEEVPELIFSEVMRDVDLFVGVTSIGNDPAWGIDQRAQHQDYWQHYSFGDLAQAAEIRRAVLERLLPKLAPLRDKCSLEGRFLVVRGSLHTYKIHLGSSNILMEPGSRYLCIVQGAGDATQNIHLPFDEDRVLSLILSKAFLLIEDARIKDESIRRQIR